MDYRKYMRRLQDALGESKAADRIEEESWWNIVMKELNYISKDLAAELQNETGQPYHKPGYDLPYEKAPPTRLLALNIAISAWIGWIMSEKHGHTYSWEKIKEAYNSGKLMSDEKQTP
jgi:hypothetical protein